MDTNKLLNALENQTNASIMDLTSLKIKDQKNNMLQQLQLPRVKLKLLSEGRVWCDACARIAS